MLDRLKADLDSIIETVKKCPTDLQEAAFKVLLEHWLRKNDPVTTHVFPTGVPTTVPASAILDTSLPQLFQTFIRANELTVHELGKVFHPLGPGAQLVASDVVGKGKAGKQLTLALLISVRQAMADGSFKCALEDLRQMCVHYNCYDGPNFAANLKNNSQFFKPRKKGEDIALSAQGMKQAATIIKSISSRD